jgi:hypothetical protein
MIHLNTQNYSKAEKFSKKPEPSGPIFMFYAPGHVFGGTDGVGSRFHVFAPGHVFGGAEGVRSHFHVLRSRTRFRRYRGRRVPLSCFALPDSFSTESRAVSCFALPNTFSAVPTMSGLIFVFSLPDTFSAMNRCNDYRIITRFINRCNDY